MGMFSDIDYSLIVLQLEKAMANGVATLDSNTKVPKAQISLTASDVGAIASTGNEVLTSLNAASGTISSGLLPSYVDDVLSYTNLAGFPGTGETGKIYVDETTNKVYRWSGSVYVEISSSATAGEALKLTNARTISTTGDATYSVSFDGSANVSSAITLATVNSNVGAFGGASSIPVITVNAKGQVTAVSTNSIGNELIAIQSLSDTPGFLKKTGDGTYSIDINSYLSLAGGTITGNLAVNGSIVGSAGAGVSLYQVSGLGSTSGDFQVLCSKAGLSGTNVITNMIIERTWLRRKADGVHWNTTSFHNGITVDVSFNIPGSTTRTWWERDISAGIQSWGDGATTYFSVDSSRFHIPLTTQSTSTTTGALRVASLGVTGAIFAGTVSANSYNLIPIGRGGGSLSTNTVTGVSALQANTTGIGMAGFGTGALQNNTTGNYSTAVGVSALLSNITGSSLTAAGLNTLRSNTTGNNSSAFGVGALQNNTTGNNLTASGVGALFNNITGSNLAGFGVDAGRYIADGITGLTVSNNSCFFGDATKGTQNATNEQVFGYNATGNGSNTVTIGDSNITNTYLKGVVSTDSTAVSTSTTTGAIRGASLGITGAIFAGTVSANSYNLIPIWRGGGNISTNTVVGMNAGLSNTTGNNNSFVGMNAGYSNTTGNNNSFVGMNAGYSNTTGNNNSFVGMNAGLSNTTGNNNSFVGVNAGRSNTTGNNNSFVGVNAGLSNTTGNNNSFVGMNAGLSNTTGNNNSFVGVNAGRYTSDGVTDLTISNNSCFFGMNTKGTQNATNENVFCYNATGNGSNTVTIGDSDITNNFFRGALSLNGTQVISTRRTGWVAPTGTATRTTFATSTVTLTQLAERVKALIDDLTTHGLIGA